MPNNKKETALATVDDDAAKQVVRRKRNRPDLEKFGEENTEPGDRA